MKQHIKIMAAVALAIAVPMAVAQQTRTTIVYTTGQGSSTDADRGQATSDATQTATNWANSSCIGIVTNTNVTFSQCSPIGSGDDTKYVCTVSVKATCEIQSRGR
jgi:mannose/fructose/N-acetylgalactosamine-specific phosphotransferase system component IIC